MHPVLPEDWSGSSPLVGEVPVRTSSAPPRARTWLAATGRSPVGHLRARQGFPPTGVTGSPPREQPRTQPRAFDGRDVETRRSRCVPSPTNRRTHMAVTVERSAGDTTIRPFTIDIPDADLEDMRARIAATRWPEREGVEDASQGVQLATMQAVARYWHGEYDWRTCEARL